MFSLFQIVLCGYTLRTTLNQEGLRACVVDFIRGLMGDLHVEVSKARALREIVSLSVAAISLDIIRQMKAIEVIFMQNFFKRWIFFLLGTIYGLEDLRDCH